MIFILLNDGLFKFRLIVWLMRGCERDINRGGDNVKNSLNFYWKKEMFF